MGQVEGGGHEGKEERMSKKSDQGKAGKNDREKYQLTPRTHLLFLIYSPDKPMSRSSMHQALR